MVTDGDQFTLIEENDFIQALDRRNAMRDHDGGFAFADFL